MINALADRRDTSIEVVGGGRGFCQTSLLILSRDDAAHEFHEGKSDMTVKFNLDVSHTFRRVDSPLINTPLKRGVNERAVCDGPEFMKYPG